jgi:two-component system, OmpR family, sensor kinase
LLTFVILCAFAVAIGSLTVHRIRADFNRQVLDIANELPKQLTISAAPVGLHRILRIEPALAAYAGSGDHAFIRILSEGGAVIAQEPGSAPSLKPPLRPRTEAGYRVVARPGIVREAGTDEPIGHVIIEYGKRTAETEATVTRVELLLLFGVLAGSGFALLAGIAIARRAMSPIAELTSAAKTIARTRDPSRRMPQPPADDEVAELARTLRGMLRELDAARAETETMLSLQRRFVADASHELRTPLTSVLANLELLAEGSEIGELPSDLGDAARSALRSSQRMRRLVADLLLLARTDVGRTPTRMTCDLAQIVVEAAGELGPVSGEHDIVIDARPAEVLASRDELHRLTINLLENALRHTPAGTEIRVHTHAADGEATLVVEDDGPGVPPALAGSLFERFVRGAGDRGGSFGLGLAIVKAVAESHGGSVALDSDDTARGARFVVRLPLAPGAREGGGDGAAAHDSEDATPRAPLRT